MEINSFRIIDMEIIRKLKDYYNYLNVYTFIEKQSMNFCLAKSEINDFIKKMRWFDYESFLMNYFVNGTLMGFHSWDKNHKTSLISADEICGELMAQSLNSIIPFEIYFSPECNTLDGKNQRVTINLDSNGAFISKGELLEKIKQALIEINPENHKIIIITIPHQIVEIFQKKSEINLIVRIEKPEEKENEE